MYFRAASENHTLGNDDVAMELFQLARDQYDVKGYADEIRMCNEQIEQLKSEKG